VRKISIGLVMALMTSVAGYTLSTVLAPGPAHAAGAHLSSPGAWSTVPTPDPSPVQSNQLGSVSCVTTSFCMAVGSDAGASDDSGLITEWNGTTWSLLPAPTPAASSSSLPPTAIATPTGPANPTVGNVLDAVSCTSTTFCMAVGSQQDNQAVAYLQGDQALTEEWNGATWSIVPSPSLVPYGPSAPQPVATAPAMSKAAAAGVSALSPRASVLKSGPLDAVSCTGPTFCMAVGGSSSKQGSQPLIEEWNGSAWSNVTTTGAAPSPPQVFEGIDCTSTAFCVAVGLEQNQQGESVPLIDGWNGSAWSSMSPTASATDGELLGVSCWGASFCMADGYTKTSVGSIDDLIEQFNGSTWTDDPTPAATSADGYGLAGMSCVGPSLCVATGVNLASMKAATGSPEVLGWNGQSWAQEASADPGPAQNLAVLYSVSCVARQFCMGVGENADSTSGDSTTLAERAPLVSNGYYVASAAGGVFALGGIPFFGSAGALTLDKPVVGIATTPDGGGYWLVASDGGIFAYGDAGFYGSTGGISLNQPIVGMAATPDGLGYWLVAADGGVFCFGDATYHGSTGSLPLQAPVVGMAATPDGGGYWLVTADGGVVAFGDAMSHGSAAGVALAKPIVGMAATPDGGGYWLVGADGGIFSFGDAPYEGSLPGIGLSATAVAVLPTATGDGYTVVTANGHAVGFGDAPEFGDVAGQVPGYAGHLVGGALVPQ
jgi:hypothetical protein